MDFWLVSPCPTAIDVLLKGQDKGPIFPTSFVLGYLELDLQGIFSPDLWLKVSRKALSSSSIAHASGTGNRLHPQGFFARERALETTAFFSDREA
jgi:hypothetical protein